MAALEREVSETFTKTAAYLGRSKFEEKEHIALLERLEFYRGLSSLTLERKKTAHDLIKDMERLLTLKESVALQVKLSGQINAAVTDAHILLTEGKRDKSEAQKIMEHIESLYAIHGLTKDQNKKLRTALSELKRAYRNTKANTAKSTPLFREADIPDVLKSYLDKEMKAARTKSAASREAAKKAATKAAEAKAKPKVVPTAPAPRPIVVAPAPAPKPAIVAPAPAPKPAIVATAPAPKPAVVAPAPEKTKVLSPKQITKKYYKIMTEVSQYLVVGKYDQTQHTKLTESLYELSGSASALGGQDQRRLSQAIEKMNVFALASKGYIGAWGAKK
jgi:hypothetical protein